MKRTFSQIILMLLVSVILWGCAGTQKDTSISHEATDKMISNIPDWVLEPPEDPNFIFETGTATSRDMQLAKDKAADAARMNIAKTMEVRFQGFSKRFQEEVGTDSDAQYLDQFTQATKAVVSQVMTGVVTEKSKIMNEGGVFRAYMLLKLPIGVTSEALLNKIKKQEQLYTRFRATETFKELEKETEAFENFKKEQGQ